jgi:AcrR family transcriptional regulator
MGAPAEGTEHPPREVPSETDQHAGRGAEERVKRLPTEQRRAQIADAALKIIAERGLRRFTVAAIAEEVGLSEGSLFRHFADKREIVRVAVERLEGQLFTAPPSTGGDPIEALGRFIRGRVELIRSHPGLLRLLFSDDLARAGSDEAADHITALKRRSMGFVLDRLREAADAGLTRPGVPPEHLLILVHGTALSLVFSRDDLQQLSGGASDAEQVWASLEMLIRR